MQERKRRFLPSAPPLPPALGFTKLPETFWQIYCARATLCQPSSAAKHVAVNDLSLAGWVFLFQDLDVRSCLSGQPAPPAGADS